MSHPFVAASVRKTALATALAGFGLSPALRTLAAAAIASPLTVTLTQGGKPGKSPTNGASIAADPFDDLLGNNRDVEKTQLQ